MAFEQETQFMVNSIFIATMILIIVVLTYQYYRSKNNKLIWYVASMLSSGIGFYFLNILLFVERDIPKPMVSEENSMILTFSLLFWIIGMLFLLIGFWINNKVVNVIR